MAKYTLKESNKRCRPRKCLIKHTFDSTLYETQETKKNYRQLINKGMSIIFNLRINGDSELFGDLRFKHQHIFFLSRRYLNK